MPLIRAAFVYRFGPFELDPIGGRLLRDGTAVRLSAPQLAILVHLVVNAGVVMSKDTLVTAGWNGRAVSDNSLEQVVHRLRHLLGTHATGVEYIETVKQHGYRFAVPVERVDRHALAGHPDAHLELDLAAVQSRLKLDTLDRGEILQARRTLQEILHQSPDHARAHTLLGMACGLAFEASVTDEYPDTATLAEGVSHARQGRELDPASGEACSTLAFVLGLDNHYELAVAAAHRAITLEPNNFRHELRLARVAWGEERLQAARGVLAVCPDFALAHWLTTTVLIARSAFAAALDEVERGCAAQDAQTRGAPFPALGLHLLRGLVLAANHRVEEAVAEVKRELPSAECGQVYARECGANTWYALGALHARQGRHAEATAAFERTLAIAPFHAAATAALRGEVRASASVMDRALGEAIMLARGNRHHDAARVYREAVVQQPPGFAGWILPVEPFLNPTAHADAWSDTLALIRVRAT